MRRTDLLRKRLERQIQDGQGKDQQRNEIQQKVQQILDQMKAIDRQIDQHSVELAERETAYLAQDRKVPPFSLLDKMRNRLCVINRQRE